MWKSLFFNWYTTVQPYNHEIYIYNVLPTWKHVWTYHGMVDDPMCSSFKAFLRCHQMPSSIPAVGVQQELFQAQPLFWTIENGDVYWCCLLFPINVGRTNLYICVYIHMLQLHLYMFLYADMKIPLIDFRQWDWMNMSDPFHELLPYQINFSEFSDSRPRV